MANEHPDAVAAGGRGAGRGGGGSGGAGRGGGAGASDDAGARALWQALPPDDGGEGGGGGGGGSVSVDDVRRRARAFERALWRRKVVLIGSGAGNVGLSAVLMWFMPDLRWALAWLMGTACWLLYQVHVRTTRALPMGGDATGLAFYRDALVRERDLARGGWWWFLVPIGVNQVVLTAAYVTSRYYHGTTAEIVGWATMGMSTLALLVVIGQRLRREAAEHQRSLDMLASSA